MVLFSFSSVPKNTFPATRFDQCLATVCNRDGSPTTVRYRLLVGSRVILVALLSVDVLFSVLVCLSLVVFFVDDVDSHHTTSTVL
jgi:hypothetical protein